MTFDEADARVADSRFALRGMVIRVLRHHARLPNADRAKVWALACYQRRPKTRYDR